MCSEANGHQCPLCGQLINPTDLAPRITGHDASKVIDYVRKFSITLGPIVSSLLASYGSHHPIPIIAGLIGIIIVLWERVYSFRTPRIQRLWDGRIGGIVAWDGPFEKFKLSLLIAPFLLYSLNELLATIERWDRSHLSGLKHSEARVGMNLQTLIAVVVSQEIVMSAWELGNKYMNGKKRSSYTQPYEASKDRYTRALNDCSRLEAKKRFRETELQTAEQDDSLDGARELLEKAVYELEKSRRLVTHRFRERHYWSCLREDKVYQEPSEPFHEDTE